MAVNHISEPTHKEIAKETSSPVIASPKVKEETHAVPSLAMYMISSYGLGYSTGVIKYNKIIIDSCLKSQG